MKNRKCKMGSLIKKVRKQLNDGLNNNKFNQIVNLI